MSKFVTLVSEDLTSVKLDLGVVYAMMLDKEYYDMNFLQKNAPD
jgi:hypothetical protein